MLTRAVDMKNAPGQAGRVRRVLNVDFHRVGWRQSEIRSCT